MSIDSTGRGRRSKNKPSDNRPSPKKGVVTFLDVLGWKGIWQRKSDPIGDLETLVKQIDGAARSQSRGLSSGDSQTETSLTRVMIISDTIVIFTEAAIKDASRAIDLHGNLCKKAIPESIRLGIPVRGATSYGDVIISSENSIYAGVAIDEAAAWHEQGDWIGVLMAPTACFIFDTSTKSSWEACEPPMKHGKQFKTYVVNWRNTEDTTFLKVIKQNFCAMAPITPEVEHKFSNTVNFLTKTE